MLVLLAHFFPILNTIPTAIKDLILGTDILDDFVKEMRSILKVCLCL